MLPHQTTRCQADPAAQSAVYRARWRLYKGVVMRLLIVDGANLLFRAFHAVPDLRNRNGMTTNALYGLAQMLPRIVRDEEPTHAAFAFDAAGPTFRDEAFDEYKANRPSMPQALAAQLPRVEPLVRALGLQVIEIEGVEADDVAATLARIARRRGAEVVIASSDKDLFQLVGPGVVVLDTLAGVRYDERAVRAKFGVRPDQIRDYLALVGDSVDNVPGVRGIGAKTARKLLERFGSVEAIYANLDALPPALRRKLEAGRDAAQLSLQLVTLRSDVPLGVDFDDLVLREPDAQALTRLLRELGLTGLVRQWAPLVQAPPPRRLRGPDELRALADQARGIWLATRRTPRGRLELTGVAVSTVDDQTAWLAVSPLDAAASRNAVEAVSAALRRHAALAGAVEWAHLEVDCGATPLPARDVLTAAWVADPGSTAGRGLEDVALQWLGERLGSGSPDATAHGDRRAPDPIWGARAARAVARLWPPVHEALVAHELTQVEEGLDRTAAVALGVAEATGLCMSASLFEDACHRVERALEQASDRVAQRAGRHINLASPAELARWIYDELGLRPAGRRGSRRSTDAATLAALSAHEPALATVLWWRRTRRFLDRTVGPLREAVRRGNAVHPRWVLHGTDDGWPKTAAPDVLAALGHPWWGPALRRAVSARPGRALVVARAPWLWVRTAAAMMGEAPEGAVRRWEASAREATRIEPSEDPERVEAVGEALAAAALGADLAAWVGESVRLAEEGDVVVAALRGREAAWYQWGEARAERVVRRGFARGASGRRLPLPDVESASPRARQLARARACRAEIDLTVADLAKACLTVGLRTCTPYGARPILWVGNALWFEVAAGEAAAFAQALRSALAAGPPWAPPGAADWKVSLP